MGRLRFTFILLLAAPLGAIAAASQRLGGAIDAYRTRTGGDFVYTVSDDGDRVTRASGIVGRAQPGDPVEAARRFLAEAEELFGVSADNLQRARATVLRSGQGEHVYLEQVVGGVPIMGPRTGVHFDLARQVVLVVNNFRAEPLAPPLPALSSAAAIAQARLALGPGATLFGAPQLVIRMDGRRQRLMYRVDARDPNPPFYSWMILVDATDPDVLPIRKSTTVEATGTGTIYPENPETTSLTSLDFVDLDGSQKLWGTYAKVYNGNSKKTYPEKSSQAGGYSSAKESDRDYTFDTTNAKFSEAMAYYHVTNTHNVLGELGFNELEKPIPVFVNLQDPSNLSKGFDNAFYSRAADNDPKWKATGYLCFGSGDTFNNLAHDSDVMDHEYGHASLDHIQPALLEELEHNYGGAYHEGWGDMVASGISGNSKLAEYGLASRTSGTWYGRDVNNTRKYPKDVIYPSYGTSEVHYTGEIMGGTFWDLYKQVAKPDMRPSASTALKAFLESNYLLDGSENFFGVRDAVLQAADASLDSKVTTAFNKHGIKGADPKNKKGKINNYSALYSTLYLFGYIIKDNTFSKGDWIVMCVDATIGGSTPAYNLVPNVTLTNAGKFDYAAALMPEALNGTGSWSGGDPYLVAWFIPGNNTPKGTYTATVELRLGGTTAKIKKSATFKIN